MKNARTVAITMSSLLIAGVCAALAIAVYTPFAYAEEATPTSASSTVTVAPEKLEKELKKFADKEANLRDKRTVAEKIKLVERRIAELKKHIERYEGLLKRLKAVEGTASTTRKGDEKRMEMRDKMKEKASSTRPVTQRNEQVLGMMVAQAQQLPPTAPTPGAAPVSVTGAPTRPLSIPVIPVCRLSFDKSWYLLGGQMRVTWNTTGASYAEFVIPARDAGKDNLVLPSGQQRPNGLASVTATVLGLPTITLKVTSPTGHTAYCNRSTSILSADATATDKRLTPFYNQLKQLSVQEQKLIEQEQKILQGKINVLNAMVGIQQKIDAILGTGSNGGTAELQFKLSDSNPDTTTIVVSSAEKTDGITVFEYTLEAKGGTIDINRLFVKLTSSENLSKVVDKVSIEINGMMFAAKNKPAATGKEFAYEFEIDRDIQIRDRESVDIQVFADIREQGSGTVLNYKNGTTIKAEVSTAERNLTLAEADEDVLPEQMSGTAVGDVHTLVGKGLALDAATVETDEVVSGENATIGTFTMEVEVTAVGSDFYIPKTTAYTMANKTVGMNYRVDNAAAVMPARGVSAALTSSADDAGSYFKVSEGSTETLMLVVKYDPTVTGTYRLQGLQINYNEAPAAPNQSMQMIPFSAFRSGFLNINQ